MIEESLETEDDYHVQKTICERVIKRLVHEDGVLIEVPAESGSPRLIVHPNYVVTDE